MSEASECNGTRFMRVSAPALELEECISCGPREGEAIIQFRVKVMVPTDSTDAAEEVGEALKDANNTRPYETDPKIVDVTYAVFERREKSEVVSCTVEWGA